MHQLILTYKILALGNVKQVHATVLLKIIVLVELLLTKSLRADFVIEFKISKSDKHISKLISLLSNFSKLPKETGIIVEIKELYNMLSRC